MWYKFLPSSSLSRTLLLISSVVLLTQGTTFWFVLYYLSPIDWEVVARDHNVRNMWIWLGCLPIFTVLGTLLGVRQIIRPLSELKRKAKKLGTAQLVSYSDNPSWSIEFREVHKTLHNVSKKLAHIHSEREMLLAEMSHDLRTPLTRLRLSSEMLPSFISNENERGMVMDTCEEISQDIDDMDNIIGQCISFIKDGGDEPVEVFNFNELIAEVLSQYPPKELKTYMQLFPNVSYRKLAIKRALVNIITNAKKYGGDQVTIRLFAEYTKLVLVIEDNGTEILDDLDINNWLDPFVRGNSEEISGSGLGFSIVKRIALLHDGVFTLERTHTGGLRTCMKLPLTST